MTIAPIITARLELHAVLPEEFELLAVDRADPRLWVDRGFANPHRHLVDDPGPLHYRIPRIRTEPHGAPFFLRMAVLRAERAIIGSAGFHLLPDESGMIEIGYGIEPAFRNQGYGKEVLLGMWRWVVAQPGVRTLRYTVSPTNAASQHVVRSLGFTHVGVQEDEEDGPEDVFEMTADDFRRTFC
mgnify:FL=1|jgi:ribosomal-protein-alanine N-acetyltransferase